MLLSADLCTKNGVRILCALLSLLCQLLPVTATVLPFGTEHSVFNGEGVTSSWSTILRIQIMWFEYKHIYGKKNSSGFEYYALSS